MYMPHSSSDNVFVKLYIFDDVISVIDLHNFFLLLISVFLNMPFSMRLFWK